MGLRIVVIQPDRFFNRFCRRVVSAEVPEGDAAVKTKIRVSRITLKGPLEIIQGFRIASSPGLQHTHIIRDLIQRDFSADHFKSPLRRWVMAEEKLIHPEEEKRFEVVRVVGAQFPKPLRRVGIVFLTKIELAKGKCRPVISGIQPVRLQEEVNTGRVVRGQDAPDIVLESIQSHFRKLAVKILFSPDRKIGIVSGHQPPC